MRVTMLLIRASGEFEEGGGMGFVTGGGRTYSNSGEESKDWRLGCFLLDEYRGGGLRRWGGGRYGGDGGNDNGGRKFLFWDVVVWIL